MNNKDSQTAKIRKTIVNVLVHIFLAILSFIWVLPIFWIILTSFRGEQGSYVNTFFPKTYTFGNYIKLFTDEAVPGWATTSASIVLLGGLQMVGLGIVGEYVGRIFEEVKCRPLYLIRDELGKK